MGFQAPEKKIIGIKYNNFWKLMQDNFPEILFN